MKKEYCVKVKESGLYILNSTYAYAEFDCIFKSENAALRVYNRTLECEGCTLQIFERTVGGWNATKKHLFTKGLVQYVPFWTDGKTKMIEGFVREPSKGEKNPDDAFFDNYDKALAFANRLYTQPHNKYQVHYRKITDWVEKDVVNKKE